MIFCLLLRHYAPTVKYYDKLSHIHHFSNLPPPCKLESCELDSSSCRSMRTNVYFVRIAIAADETNIFICDQTLRLLALSCTSQCSPPPPPNTGTCAHDRCALQQLDLNVHVKHSDLTLLAYSYRTFQIQKHPLPITDSSQTTHTSLYPPVQAVPPPLFSPPFLCPGQRNP